MRILHSADWHLGAELKHVSRLSDQMARIDEVLQVCDERNIDLLLVAGDFIDEKQSERMTPVLRRFGDMLRPRLRRGLHVVILAGNHDREWVFPFLQAARDLFVASESSRLQFVWKPDLRVIETRSKERVRLMLLPYPRQTAYDLEAIVFKDAADRHRQLGNAVKQRIKGFESQIKKDRDKMPTVVVAHLLISGQKENGHELTEEADVPIPRVYLPNYAYVALGHVHLPTQLGSATCRYSGSIERMDFGERNQPKEVVLVELDKSGLVGEPEAVALHPTELIEIDWHDGDDLVAIARGIAPNTICKLRLHALLGTNVQALQAQARDMIARLCWPPEIQWQDSDVADAPAGSLALARADWQGAVRSYVKAQVPEDDPQHRDILAAIEELLAEESIR